VRDNAASKMILYVDGVERVSTNLAAAQIAPLSDGDTSLDLVSIGAGVAAGSTTFENRLTGAVDDVAIYSRALTATEVADLFNKPDGICP
jgi:hypothetical protein